MEQHQFPHSYGLMDIEDLLQALCAMVPFGGWYLMRAWP